MLRPGQLHVPLQVILWYHQTMGRLSYEDAFWRKVEQSENCWLWQAATDKDGYGVFRHRRAHHVSWELAHSMHLPNGQVVCHECDTPGCVRPSHLWLGDHESNIEDRHSKGRTACGRYAGPAKLTEDTVVTIKSLRAQGWTLRRIGEKYGVSLSTIGKITTGVNWKHVGG